MPRNLGDLLDVFRQNAFVLEAGLEEFRAGHLKTFLTYMGVAEKIGSHTWKRNLVLLRRGLKHC